MDNQGTNKAELYSICKDLAREFDFAKKLNSAARQASAQRAWAAISSFYARCKKRLTPVGSPDHGSETRQGAKPQSKNYHKARKRLGKIHLKVTRQRKDWATKQARCVVASNDVVVYEDLKMVGSIDPTANMVKNHNLAKSISDAGWYQYTQWLDYYGKIWDKAVVAVNPAYTSQDCSNCGHRVKKALSTRTHSCPSCKVEICRDTNAALNILHKGLNILGVEWNKKRGGSPAQHGTSGHEESDE